MQRPWYRSLLEYGSLVGLPAIGLLVILDYGKMLEAPPAAEAITSSTQSVGSGGSGLAMLLQLIVQMAVILVACRAVGYAFRAVKQPQVVGDMLAGILLGPSLLGWVAPGGGTGPRARRRFVYGRNPTGRQPTALGIRTLWSCAFLLRTGADARKKMR